MVVVMMLKKQHTYKIMTRTTSQTYSTISICMQTTKKMKWLQKNYKIFKIFLHLSQKASHELKEKVFIRIYRKSNILIFVIEKDQWWLKILHNFDIKVNQTWKILSEEKNQ